MRIYTIIVEPHRKYMAGCDSGEISPVRTASPPGPGTGRPKCMLKRYPFTGIFITLIGRLRCRVVRGTSERENSARKLIRPTIKPQIRRNSPGNRRPGTRKSKRKLKRYPRTGTFIMLIGRTKYLIADSRANTNSQC